MPKTDSSISCERLWHALLALLVLCLGCRDREGTDGSGTARAERGPFEVAVVEDGELRALTQTTITSKVSGKIEWLVAEGTEVRQGDVMVELEKKEFEESLERTEEDLKDTEAQLEDLVETLESQKKELEDQVRVADVAVKVAELKLKMLEESPTDREKDEAKANLERDTLAAKQAGLDRKRTEALARDGVVSHIDLEKDQMKAKIADAELEASKFTYETLLKGPAELDLRQARIAVESARLERDLAAETFASERAKLEGQVEELTAKVRKIRSRTRRLKAKIDARTLRAPHEGIVMYHKQWRRHSTDAKIEVGSRVWPGMALIELPDLRKMKVITQVSEFVIRHVKIGDAATVKIDLVPGKVYPGRIMWIDRWGRDKNAKEDAATRRKLGLAGFNVFATEVEILEEDPNLKLGFKARSKIPIKRLAEAVYVPKEAIFLHDHQPYVEVIKNGATTQQDVVLGEENEESFTIESGLSGGEEVVLQ